MQQAGRGMLRAGAKDQDSLVATSLHDGLQDARRGPQDWNTRTAQAAQNVPSLPRLLEVRSDEGLVERGPGPEGLLREVQAPGDIDGVALPEGLVRARRGFAARRPAGRLSDGNVLRARRRSTESAGDRGDFRGQRPAGAHGAAADRRGPRRRLCLRAGVLRHRRAPRRGLLARGTDPGPAGLAVAPAATPWRRP